jgi:hypothetical protein
LAQLQEQSPEGLEDMLVTSQLISTRVCLFLVLVRKALAGAAVGTGSGTTTGHAGRERSFENIFVEGLTGAFIGGAIGGILGGTEFGFRDIHIFDPIYIATRHKYGETLLTQLISAGILPALETAGYLVGSGLQLTDNLFCSTLAGTFKCRTSSGAFQPIRSLIE